VIPALTSDSCIYVPAFSRKHQSLDDTRRGITTVFLTVAGIIRHLASTRTHGANRSSVSRKREEAPSEPSASSRSSERNQKERETQRRRRRLVPSDFISMPRSLAKWNGNLIEGTQERTVLRERSNLEAAVIPFLG